MPIYCRALGEASYDSLLARLRVCSSIGFSAANTATPQATAQTVSRCFFHVDQAAPAVIPAAVRAQHRWISDALYRHTVIPLEQALSALEAFHQHCVAADVRWLVPDNYYDYAADGGMLITQPTTEKALRHLHASLLECDAPGGYELTVRRLDGTGPDLRSTASLFPTAGSDLLALVDRYAESTYGFSHTKMSTDHPALAAWYLGVRIALRNGAQHLVDDHLGAWASLCGWIQYHTHNRLVHYSEGYRDALRAAQTAGRPPDGWAWERHPLLSQRIDQIGAQQLSGAARVFLLDHHCLFLADVVRIPWMQQGCDDYPFLPTAPSDPHFHPPLVNGVRREIRAFLHAHNIPDVVPHSMEDFDVAHHLHRSGPYTPPGTLEKSLLTYPPRYDLTNRD